MGCKVLRPPAVPHRFCAFDLLFLGLCVVMPLYAGKGCKAVEPSCLRGPERFKVRTVRFRCIIQEVGCTPVQNRSLPPYDGTEINRTLAFYVVRGNYGIGFGPAPANKVVQINQQGISCKCREGCIRTVTISGRSQGKYLPERLSGRFQPVDESICAASKCSDSCRTRQ